MSRRYGRNQKRRAREELQAVESQVAAAESQVAKLHAAREMDAGLMAHIGRKLDRAEKFVGRVLDVVNRFSTLDDASDHPGGAVGAPSFRMPVEQRMSLSSMSDRQQDRIRAEIMHVINCKSFFDYIAPEMHLRVELAGGEVGYAISDTALKRMGEDELYDTIIVPMARQLVREIKNLKKRSV